MLNKRLIWEGVEKSRKSYEKAETQRIRKALTQAMAPYYATEPKSYGQAKKNLSKINEKPITKAITDLYINVGVGFAREQEEELVKVKSKNDELFETQMQVYLSRFSANKVTGITDTIREQIRTALVNFAASGYDIAKAWEELMALNIGMELWRANRIARTEITSASGFGREIGAKATGLDLDKVWITTFDGRARPTHVAADEQRVPFDKSFQVGSSQLRHPADPQGAAKETVNCRCADAYIVNED
jgi:hypothetical protein